MHFKNLFKINKTKSWDNLTNEQKQTVASKLSRIVKAMSGARYKIVSGSDQYQRELGITETRSEDEILNHQRRGQLLDLARNATRNSSIFTTILRQFDFHAVGQDGGKCILSFADSDYAKTVREQFASWTRNADFFDGLNFNTLLKLILKTYLIGGDEVLLFDDGLLSDSGRILLYEPDEIGNTTDDALFARYGKKAKQSLGRVYNEYGQFQGVIVSKSQRGQEIFNPKQSYLLKRDPNGNTFDDLWLMPRNIFRINQGRGITPTSASLATILDLESFIGFELAASKKNAQTLAVVSKTKPDVIDIPDTFDKLSNEDVENMTDEQIQKLIEAQNQETPTMSLDVIRNAGTIYQVMPEDYRLELLDTKHPNNQSIEFVRWLANQSGATFGLTSSFTTLNVDNSYSGFRGETLLAEPAFQEAQHFLEQICDWVFYRWSKWAVKKGIIENKFQENYMRNVSWCWDKLRDVDTLKEINAQKLQLASGISSYREILGSDWQEKLLQISDEIKFCQQNGIPHPSLQTVSGQLIETGTDDNEDNLEEKQ